jgi:hypothetical protein
MALSKKNLQRKREMKKKKRPVKTETAFSADDYWSEWPMYECWLSTTLWQIALGQLIVTRKISNGQIAIAIFHLDTMFTGIKNCSIGFGEESHLRGILEDFRIMCGPFDRVEPTYANTLVNKLLAYARQYDFKPHENFTRAKKLLRNLPIDETLEFPFGASDANESEADKADMLNIMRALEW